MKNNSTNDVQKVLKKVFQDYVGGQAKSFAAKTATKKFVSTAVGRTTSSAMTKTIRQGVNTMCNSYVGKKTVQKAASGICGKAIKGATARSVATKAVRGNVITNTFLFAANSIPDTYRVCTGKITAKEYGKRTAVNAANTAGGSAGYFIGMTIGTALCPGIGTTIGGLIGSVAGSACAGKGVKKLFF